MLGLSVIDRPTKVMSRLIATIISGLSRPHFPFIVLESSLVQSCLPVLRAFVNERVATTHVLIFCLLYPPSAFAADDTSTREGLHVIDRTAQVPGYSETSSPDLAKSILNSVKQAPDGPLTVIIDAADVLCADLESPSKSYALIATLLAEVSARPKPSRLILHFSTHSPLRDLVLTPRLSSTLAHVIAHPPALLKHLATTHLTPPPPASTPDRFWSVFAPLSARTWEVERIVLGPGGVGLCDDGEVVLQVVTRGRGRNVERDLDGWTLNGPCSLSDLDSLKGILEDRGKPRRAEHVTSFNLDLTPEQRESRAKVPLPYAHKDASQSSGAILYDPDSADDIDDDDPDEDLDI